MHPTLVLRPAIDFGQLDKRSRSSAGRAQRTRPSRPRYSRRARVRFMVAACGRKHLLHV